MRSYVTFKNSYIQLEDVKGKYRPVFKEYTDKVPTLNLQSPTLYCPFLKSKKSEVSSPSTKKREVPEKPGYCEFCVEKYRSYADHVASESHLHFANNSDNYREVDSFIAEYTNSNLVENPYSENSLISLSNKYQTFIKNNSSNDRLEFSEWSSGMDNTSATSDDFLAILKQHGQ